MEKIYNISYSGFVLGSLMNDLTLLYNSNYPLDKDDFAPFIVHKIVFVSLTLLADKGATSVDPKDIAEVLRPYPEQEEALKQNLQGNYIDYLATLKELDNFDAYGFYYNEVRKRSLLRKYRDNGYNITEIFDENKDVEKEDANLNKWTIETILDYFDKTQAELRQQFLIDEDTKEKKAGENGHEIVQSFKNNPIRGLSFESKYLTTLWGGWRTGQLYLRSSDTSGGKSRSTIGDLAQVCCPYIYDLDKKDFVENPNGKNNAGLYIGAEMNLDEEVDPLFYAYVSGIESHTILQGETTEEEDKILSKAIDIVHDAPLWIVDMPSFDIHKLHDTIKFYVKEYGVKYVVFDYILLNSALVNEYNKSRGGKGNFRGDEVLADLSKALKDMCAEFDIGILSATQVNGDISDYRNRNYSVIRGAKAVADKITCGSIQMPITKAEEKLIEPYISKYVKGFGADKKVNFVETVYKSRFSSYPKECKIFSYYNLGNLRKHEWFCTNANFEPIDIPKTIVCVED